MGVHLLGIRHHGPGSARAVVAALDELGPSIVLVEAPADTAAALGWVGHPDLVPPVALLGHVVDDPRRAAFAPLARFSPEWQAVAWANRHDVPVDPIDLPLATTLARPAHDDRPPPATEAAGTARSDPDRAGPAPQPAPPDRESRGGRPGDDRGREPRRSDAAPGEDSSRRRSSARQPPEEMPADAPAVAGRPRDAAPEEVPMYSRPAPFDGRPEGAPAEQGSWWGRPSGDPLAALAAAAGEDDPERWWEDVIEHRGGGLDAFAAVAEAMAAVRSGTVTSPSEEQREAHMRTRLRAARRAGHEVIAVVCGAWHVPALDLDAAGVPNATADARTLRGRPKVKVGVSWVPWTHARLAATTGYRAGVRSPGWYDHVFAHPGPAGVAEFFVVVARVLRDAGMPASPDHLIAATRLAESLAILRGRPRAGLDEVLDAADAVMGGLPLIRNRVFIGDALGSVPDAAPQVPLARDLAARQRSARLRPTSDERVIELDLRTPNGRRRSHLLHQVAALGIGWGTLTDGRGSSGTFRETWRVRWEPDAAVRVIERAGDGTTLLAAATRRLIDRSAATDSLVGVAAALEAALLADLPDAVRPIVDRLARRAAHDTDIAALAGALGPLATARRYGDVRATDAEALTAVFDGLVVRVLAGLGRACASLDDDAAVRMADHLAGVGRALALVEHPARHERFPAVLAELAESAGHGVVQGRATRLLHDGEHWAAGRVEARLSRALSGGTPPDAGAAFVEGFVAGSGTVLVHDAELRAVVDRWIASLPHDAFVETAPLLRRTFGSFEAAERRQLGRLVAGAEPDRPAGFGDDVDPVRAAAALVTVRHLLGLPVAGVPAPVRADQLAEEVG